MTQIVWNVGPAFPKGRKPIAMKIAPAKRTMPP